MIIHDVDVAFYKFLISWTNLTGHPWNYWASLKLFYLVFLHHEIIEFQFVFSRSQLQKHSFTKVCFAMSRDVSRAHLWNITGNWLKNNRRYIWKSSKPCCGQSIAAASLSLPSFSLQPMFAQKVPGKLLHAWFTT